MKNKAFIKAVLLLILILCLIFALGIKYEEGIIKDKYPYDKKLWLF